MNNNKYNTELFEDHVKKCGPACCYRKTPINYTCEVCGNKAIRIADSDIIFCEKDECIEFWHLKNA